MRILHTIAEVRVARASLRAQGRQARSLSLVPTMGALHAGHLSLVRAARDRDRGGAVAVSIFVNPTQFGPKEDYAKYPRTLEADCALLSEEGVDWVFAPTVEEMYPEGGPRAVVHVNGVSERLDGASRPGHFDGVATVVSQLLHIFMPERAYFGQKDAAQVAVLRAMVRALHFPVELEVCPIVREPDGLAMSSRNRYLTAEQRQQALALSHSLRLVEGLAAAGERRAAELIAAARIRLDAEPGLRVDYVAAVDPLTLEPVGLVRAGSLFAVAAYAGATRLIDNVVL